MRIVTMLIAASVSACAGSAQTPTAAPAPQAEMQEGGELSAGDESTLPPSVLSADAELHCNISSSANGRQTLHLLNGQGLEFDVEVSPIVDGVVEARGPTHGGAYRFTSHLAAPGKGNLSGVGEVTFDALETKVNVAIDHYQQPRGEGTELTFETKDMAARGIYVEFAGRAHTANGERFAFRVTLGAPGEGSGGAVTPSTDARFSQPVQKMVMIRAPETTVVAAQPAPKSLSEKTTVQRLR